MLPLIRFLFVGSLLAFAAMYSPPAHARRGQIAQGSTGNRASVLRPKPTRTGHEIGVENRFPIDPTLITLRFRYRYIVPESAAQGPLSGFWFEFAGGPTFPYGGGDVFGNVAFSLGYEFDPFRDLALTFSPVVHNDLYFFTPGWNYTFLGGAIIRLYLGGHFVLFFEPASFGFVVRSDSSADFAYQAGLGFGYKF